MLLCPTKMLWIVKRLLLSNAHPRVSRNGLSLMNELFAERPFMHAAEAVRRPGAGTHVLDACVVNIAARYGVCKVVRHIIQRNLLDFFIEWGAVLNSTTRHSPGSAQQFVHARIDIRREV